jgi:peptidoglycan/LPS O-acetylase OafA/YrhL
VSHFVVDLNFWRNVMKRIIGILMVVVALVSVVGCATFKTPLSADHEARAVGIDSQVRDN